MSTTSLKHTSGSFSHKSLSNSSLGDGNSVYCVCRSSDCSTFMIACDACNIWYHGSCIGISEKESARIENFFCHQCREKTPSLQIKYNKPQKEIEEKLSKCIRKRLQKEATLLSLSANSEQKHNEASTSDRKSREHSSSADQFVNDDSASNQSDSSSSSINLMTRQQQALQSSTSGAVRPFAVQPVQYESLLSRDELEQTVKTCANTTKRSLMTKNVGTTGKRKRNVSASALPTVKREPQSDLSFEEDTKTLSSRRRRRLSEKKTHQCYGPGCLFEARPSSKYCSDKCGLELARNRLLQFLPMRFMQWQTIPSIADTLNKKSIDEIRTEIEEIKQRLLVLDERQQKLNDIIERGKELKAIKDTNKIDNTNEEPDGVCFCVLCNQEISQKTYTRHVDKCFIRFESQVSYGSNVKSNIEGLFCDNFDRTNNLYCKRLKVICPEHSRDPKIGPDEACGCPLEKDLFEVSNELCTAPKRLCSKHFKWDRKYRAQIDLERLHELMRYEELVEKENRLRTAINERGSVAGLLLHKTTAH